VLKQRGHKPKSIALPVERKLSALSLDDMDAQSLSGLYIDTDEKQKGCAMCVCAHLTYMCSLCVCPCVY